MTYTQIILAYVQNQKLQTFGEQDSIFKNESERGYNNFINLIGIESPGLTASMAIGDHIINQIV
jgi:Predicted dehydrogenase